METGTQSPLSWSRPWGVSSAMLGPFLRRPLAWAEWSPLLPPAAQRSLCPGEVSWQALGAPVGVGRGFSKVPSLVLGPKIGGGGGKLLLPAAHPQSPGDTVRCLLPLGLPGPRAQAQREGWGPEGVAESSPGCTGPSPHKVLIPTWALRLEPLPPRPLQPQDCVASLPGAPAPPPPSCGAASLCPLSCSCSPGLGWVSKLICGPVMTMW